MQDSLILGSMFQIEATARPGHTAEELEKAIDEELAAFRATPPTAAELERARNTIETNIIGGLERLGGFGGIADRLNSYNHYLKNPGFLAQDIQRYRAVTPASVLAFAKANLAPNARGVVYAVPGTPAAPAQARPQRPPAAPASAAQADAGPSINVDEPWRNQQPKPGPAQPLQLATPTTATLPNGLTLILSEKHEVPIVAANLVFRGGSDSNPADKPGLANFAAAMLDEGTSTRNALAIADQLARLGASLGTGSSMDSMTVSARSLAKNFPATLDLRGRRVAAAVVPGRRDRAPARAAPGTARAAARQPGGARGHGGDAGGVRHAPSLWLRRDRHRGVGEGDVARRHAGVLEGALRAEQRRARRGRRHHHGRSCAPWRTRRSAPGSAARRRGRSSARRR